MFKVVYQLPFNSIREIFLSEEELDAWLRWRWLRERILSYEKIAEKEKSEILLTKQGR